MTAHTRRATLALTALLVWQAAPVRAHRLDEYLQATRVAVGLDRVALDIDLTPGVAVAPQIVASIDGDHDGQISAAERRAYGEKVLNEVALSLDDRPVHVTLAEATFPDLQAMISGTGVIRLQVRASISRMPPGRHRLGYLNTHRPETSVYLVNALIPDDPRIRIVDQRRDRAQHGLTLDYDVAGDPRWTRMSWLLGGFATLALLAIARRPDGLGASRVRGPVAPA